ncbi:MAG: NusG domain II-containing protein [Lachnospiraceae bacterium]|nr:NusG domain II-containing protein [Lachnospiraceae bacterium]
MKYKFRLRDYIALGLLIILGVGICITALVYPKTAGDKVIVEVDGVEFGSYNLSEDDQIDILVNDKVTNVLEIHDGAAHMIEANCPDKVCIHQGDISNDGQVICCLPNKVVVRIVSDSKSEYDSISQ